MNTLNLDQIMDEMEAMLDCARDEGRAIDYTIETESELEIAGQKDINPYNLDVDHDLKKIFEFGASVIKIELTEGSWHGYSIRWFDQEQDYPDRLILWKDQLDNVNYCFEIQEAE